MGSQAAKYGGRSELLYDQFDLFSCERVRHQIVLLRDCIHNIKLTFNKEFDEVLKLKEAEIKRIKVSEEGGRERGKGKGRGGTSTLLLWDHCICTCMCTCLQMFICPIMCERHKINLLFKLHAYVYNLKLLTCSLINISYVTFYCQRTHLHIHTYVMHFVCVCVCVSIATCNVYMYVYVHICVYMLWRVLCFMDTGT